MHDRRVDDKKGSCGEITTARGLIKSEVTISTTAKKVATRDDFDRIMLKYGIDIISGDEEAEKAIEADKLIQAVKRGLDHQSKVNKERYNRNGYSETLSIYGAGGKDE